MKRWRSEMFGYANGVEPTDLRYGLSILFNMISSWQLQPIDHHLSKWRQVAVVKFQSTAFKDTPGLDFSILPTNTVLTTSSMPTLQKYSLTNESQEQKSSALFDFLGFLKPRQIAPVSRPLLILPQRLKQSSPAASLFSLLLTKLLHALVTRKPP